MRLPAGAQIQSGKVLVPILAACAGLSIHPMWYLVWTYVIPDIGIHNVLLAETKALALKYWYAVCYAKYWTREWAPWRVPTEIPHYFSLKFDKSCDTMNKWPLTVGLLHRSARTYGSTQAHLEQKCLKIYNASHIPQTLPSHQSTKSTYNIYIQS